MCCSVTIWVPVEKEEIQGDKYTARGQADKTMETWRLTIHETDSKRSFTHHMNLVQEYEYDVMCSV